MTEVEKIILNNLFSFSFELRVVEIDKENIEQFIKIKKQFLDLKTYLEALRVFFKDSLTAADDEFISKLINDIGDFKYAEKIKYELPRLTEIIENLILKKTSKENYELASNYC